MNTFFSYAFRPFFLLNAVFALCAIALWLVVLHTPMGLAPEMLSWHGHEMLVGFGMAAVAGFSLTAVATWTGRPPVSGTPLILLVTLWVIGRLIMLAAARLPPWVIGAVDSAFPVLLAIILAREVFAAGNRRNFAIVGIAVLLAALNISYHLGVAGIVPELDRVSLFLLMHLLLLLITVIGGRIVPNFTANYFRHHNVERLPHSSIALDTVVIALTVVTGIYASVAPANPITGYLAFATAAAHVIRLARWRGLASWREPLLFVLHAGYAWLPIGYALTGSAVFGWFVPTAAVHAFGMGAIGSMILAVMTRVALGHTDRPLHAARMTVIAYGCFAFGILARVLSPMAGNYAVALDFAGLGWIVAFALFLWVYWPILTK